MRAVHGRSSLPTAPAPEVVLAAAGRASLLAILGLLVWTVLAAAQDGTGYRGARSLSPETLAECPEGRIDSVEVEAGSLFPARDDGEGENDTRFGWAYDLAESIHARTRTDVVRRTLLFREGDCYDPRLLEESERLLRSYEFLSRAEVVSQPDGDGRVAVRVRTRDEWSRRIDARVRLSDGLELEGARIEEVNLFGTGRTVGLFFARSPRIRGWGVSFLDPQLGGRRWQLHGHGGRTDAGPVLHQALLHPFVGEVGRWSASQVFRRESYHFEYVVPGEERRFLLVPVESRGFEIGGRYRLGRPGRWTLLGMALNFDEVSYPGGMEALWGVGPDGQRERPDQESPWAADLAERTVPLRTARIFLVMGQRSLRWATRRGLDSLEGQEDIALGTEVELAVAPTLPGRQHDNALFSRVWIYTGIEAGTTLGLVRLLAEGHRDGEAAAGEPEWRDVFVEGELLVYAGGSLLPGQRFLLRAAGSGGWYTAIPFQLTLGGDHGVRTHRAERYSGGRRAVFTLEDRFGLGRAFNGALGLGGAVFVDVGRVWPGDALFGGDSGWRAGAGIALRGAMPPEGKTPFRLEIGFPVETEGWRAPRFRFSIGEMRGHGDRWADPKVVRSRHRALPEPPFHFPGPP